MHHRTPAISVETLPPSGRSAAVSSSVSRRRFIATAALLFPAAPFLASCGYRLGPQGALPFSTLSIQPVKNESYAPQIQSLLHEQLAASFARENGVRLVAEGAQATLRIRIVRYAHDVAATDPHDTALGSSFHLRLRVHCDLLNNANPAKPYFTDRQIEVTTVAHTPAAAGAAGGFSAVEYQTLPVLTRDLARKIRDTVTGTW
jgi:outer membrane lipopolysaccharide assembly protein LptE/RlpB